MRENRGLVISLVDGVGGVMIWGEEAQAYIKIPSLGGWEQLSPKAPSSSPCTATRIEESISVTLGLLSWGLWGGQ